MSWPESMVYIKVFTKLLLTINIVFLNIYRSKWNIFFFKSQFTSRMSSQLMSSRNGLGLQSVTEVWMKQIWGNNDICQMYVSMYQVILKFILYII